MLLYTALMGMIEMRKIMDINFESEGEDYNEFFDGNIIVTGDEIILQFLSYNFKRRLKDKELYDDLIDDLKMQQKNFGVDEETLKQLDEALMDITLTPKNKYFSTFNTIRLFAENPYECLAFVKNNISFFSDKVVILPGIYKLEHDSYLDLLKVCASFRELLPNNKFEVCVEACVKTYSIEDYIEAYKIIDNIVNIIKNLNLSPLEQIMFAYDVVKKRKYKEEKEGEKSFTSHDLISSLIGNSIVCVGFSTIFECILERLGFNPSRIHLSPTDDVSKDGHDRTCCFVDDPKYSVLGHFFFDVTMDARKENEKSQNNYDLFLRPLNDMIYFDSQLKLAMTGTNFLYPSLINRLKRELPDEYTHADFSKYCKSKKFNLYLKDLGMDEISIDYDGNNKSELINALQTIYKSFNSPIEPEKLLELIYNVRKIEYYLNPDEYPFTIEDIKSCLKLNRFNKNSLDPKMRLLLTKILEVDEDTFFRAKREKIIDETFNECRKKEIEAIKLTRALRSHLINQNK